MDPLVPKDLEKYMLRFHRHTFVALTLMAAGGILGSDYPLPTAQAEEIGLNHTPTQSPPNKNIQTQNCSVQLAALTDAITDFTMFEEGRAADTHSVQRSLYRPSLLVHYGLSHSKSVLGLPAVEGTALLGQGVPVIYRTGGYIGRSVMDKGGSLTRTPELTEQFELKLMGQTPSGYGLSVNYRLTNPTRDAQGKAEQGYLLGQYLEQSIFVPICKTPASCETQIQLGSTGSHLTLSVTSVDKKETDPSTSASP